MFPSLSRIRNLLPTLRMGLLRRLAQAGKVEYRLSLCRAVSAADITVHSTIVEHSLTATWSCIYLIICGNQMIITAYGHT